MYGVVRRVLRDPSQAEEVTQEVFVEIWKQAARFDGARGSVRTWAVTIAHRRAVDRVRSEQAHRDRQLRSAGVELDGETDTRGHGDRHRGPAPGADRHGGPLGAAARGARAGVLRGLTHVQIADHLGVALGTVKTRIRDGLIRLRTVMGVER